MNSHCLGRERAEAKLRGKRQVTGFIVPSFDATLISLICCLAGILQARTLQARAPHLPNRLSRETEDGRGLGFRSSGPLSQHDCQHLAFVFCERGCGVGVIWGFELLHCACEQGPYVREESGGAREDRAERG